MDIIIAKITKIAHSIWDYGKSIVTLSAIFVLDVLFKLVDLVLPLMRVAHFVKTNMPRLWGWITSLGWFKGLISRRAFRKYGSSAPARPHQFTMATDYTTWHGFVDRTITGRHLPQHSAKNLPDPQKVVELFLRSDMADDTSHQIDCVRSTFMFAAFAQWFTDSFLRTAHAMDFDEDGNAKRDKKGALKRLTGRVMNNTSTHEIDLCQIYGLNKNQTDILRLHDQNDRGCLKYQSGKDGEYPPYLLDGTPDLAKKGELRINKTFEKLHPDENIIRSIFLKAGGNKKGYETIFAVGLEHGNATIGNSLLNTVFLREHNRIARLIAADNTDWNDDRVFETTRNVMIVLLLKIVISDYIRHISPLNLPLEFQPGIAERENWYRTNRISIEFNLLYRWHSLVPDALSFMPKPNDPSTFLHNNLWLMETGVGNAIDLFSNQPACRIIIGNTVRFLEPVKRDTIALMRAANLATYNEYRERFNLPKAKKYEDITDDKNLIKKLRNLYGDDVDALEWYVGLFAEMHGPDMIMGDLLLKMVGHDAFTHALTNPLLSKEVFVPKTFSSVGWKIINETSTLDHIVQRIVKKGKNVKCAFSHS